ncbi:MAG: DUF1648 domain-containing protein [Acidobacteriota bacterium]|nr:DUF1648 domain-containing protein [Acidobacteriota bacterium]
MPSRFDDDKWSYTALVAMLALAAFMWPRLPAQVPVHWNGLQPDQFGPKWVGLLFLPISAGALFLFMLRSGPTQAVAVFARVRAIVCVVFLLLYVDSILMIVGYDIDTAAVLGVVLLVIGMMAPDLKADRTTQRLEAVSAAARVWERASRAAARLLMGLGIVGVALGLVAVPASVAILLALLGAGTVALGVYAWRALQEERARR